MSVALLAAIDISAEAWKSLPPEKKTQIREKFKQGKVGLAKILTKNAKKLIKKKKQAPKKAKKKPKKKVKR